MRRPTLAIAGLLLAVCFLSMASHLNAQEKKWKPLMDGKTLAGWHPVGLGQWTVEDGAFVGRAKNEKLYGLLFSDATFKDFTVRFKFKHTSGDSGFYIRTEHKKPDQAHGFQVQVGPVGSGNGRIYESYGRNWLIKPDPEQEKKIIKANDWNEMVISAHGGHVIITVNGVTTCDWKDDKGRPEGHFALQMHSGTNNEVRFKDMAISE